MAYAPAELSDRFIVTRQAFWHFDSSCQPSTRLSYRAVVRRGPALHWASDRVPCEPTRLA
eukprot:306915-Hanusia_phi.AAC.6